MTEMANAECGEVFYGDLPPGTLYADFSVPRVCRLPDGHPGGHSRWVDER